MKKYKSLEISVNSYQYNGPYYVHISSTKDNILPEFLEWVYDTGSSLA